MKPRKTMSKTSEGTISPVILNQSNLVAGVSANNVYRYQFPGSASFSDAKVAISNVQMFYSWQNVSSTYANNTLSIIFPQGAGTSTLSITFPNGTYSATDLNAYLQSQMVSNNFYLVDSNANNRFYIEIVENSVRYSLQINSYVVPQNGALPAGWTNPGWTLPTYAANTPQMVIPSTSIQALLGFTAATYPAAMQATSYSVLSSTVPQLSPVSSIIVHCNLVQNSLSNPQTVLYSFSPGGTSYGDLIQSNAFEYSWVDIHNGTYSSIDVYFTDQSFNALNILDTNIVVFLLIKK